MPLPKTILLTVAHTIAFVEGYTLTDINKNYYLQGSKDYL